MDKIKLKDWFNKHIVVKSIIEENKNISYILNYVSNNGKSITIKEIKTNNKEGDERDCCSFIIVSSKIKDDLEKGLQFTYEDIDFILLEAILYGRFPFTDKGWKDEKVFFDKLLKKNYLVWNYFGEDEWNTGIDYINMNNE